MYDFMDDMFEAQYKDDGDDFNNFFLSLVHDSSLFFPF